MRLLASLASLAIAFPALALVNDPFPQVELSSPAAAMQVLTSRSAGSGCVSAGDSVVGPAAADPTLNSALDRLTLREALPLERRVDLGHGTLLRYAGPRQTEERTQSASPAADVRRALFDVRRLIDGRLGLALPAELEVVIQDLGPGLDAYCVAGGDSASILIDSDQARDPRALRESIARQFAHAVVAIAGPHAADSWSAAFADWTLTQLDGTPEATALAAASARLSRLDRGLFDAEAAGSGGQWIWFAFLDQAYGPAAVAGSIRELASDADALVALDRALLGAAGESLQDAFREFHLWSLLTGGRADGHHFNFAVGLETATFASESDGLPALSVQTDAPMGHWSATQVRLLPEASDGGLGVRFEGEFGSEWEADLLVLDHHGQLRRMALELDEGAGSAIVPLQNVAEAILMIRRLSGDEALQRYTYAGHREAAYPWVLGTTTTSRQEFGATIEWETGSEQDLIGFNVLRSRLGGSVETPVNPVWIPALGEQDDAMLYEFLDRDVEPGVTYRYRVEAITSAGWTTRSPYFVLRAD